MTPNHGKARDHKGGVGIEELPGKKYRRRSLCDIHDGNKHPGLGTDTAVDVRGSGVSVAEFLDVQTLERAAAYAVGMLPNT